MNISNTQATYAPIYPSSIISHDTEEFNPVNEGILEDTEAKAATDTAAKTAPRKIATDAEADLLKMAGYDVEEGDELTEEQIDALKDAASALLGGIITKQNMTPEEEAKRILAGEMEATQSTAQVVIDKVVDMIKAGFLPVSTLDLRSPSRRQAIVNNVVSALNKVREQDIKDIAGNAAKKAGGGKAAQNEAYQKAAKEAEYYIPKFKELPPAIISAILEVSGTVRVYATKKAEEYDKKQLIFRVYMNGKPTIWQTISTTGINGAPLVEIADIINGLNSGLSKDGKYNIIGSLMQSENILIQDTDKNAQGNFIWFLNGIADISRVKWNAPAGRNLTPEGNVFDFYEYGTEKAEELVYRFIPFRMIDDVMENVKDMQCPDKFNLKDGTHWNPIDGVKEVFFDNEQYKAVLMFQIMQGGIRGTNYGRSFIFKDATEGAGGGNAKSTISNLIGNVLGADRILHVSIADMAEDERMLSGLETKTAIISDEMPDGSRAYKADRYKQLCRQDGAITFNRKYQSAMTVFWRGVMIQCTNPKGIRFKDDSDSADRVYEVVEFNKSFAAKGTVERKYIKDNYICDKEVLHYLRWYVLACIPMVDIGTGFDPELLAKLTDAKDRLRTDSRPAWQFLDEKFMPKIYVDEQGQEYEVVEFPHKRIPLPVLWLMYRGWTSENGTDAGRQHNFNMRVMQWCNAHKGWCFTDTDKQCGLLREDVETAAPALERYSQYLYTGKEYLTEVRSDEFGQERTFYKLSLLEKKKRFAGWIEYRGEAAE